MNIKFFNLLIALFLFIGSTFAQKQPKYIFFMIGDGMGLNQVQAAEIYKASLDNKNTVYPTVFSQFPYATFATSHSQSHGVTDSGAGGTALAVGYKTKNGVIAMDRAGVKAYKSIAYLAKEKGMKVGITTSVSIDHATPASFYANQPDRDMYYEIGLDIIKSNFDFFAGSGFLKPTTNAKKEEVASIFPQLEKAGYKLLYGLDDYKKANKSGKLILMNNKGTNPVCLKFAIDQKPGDLNLSEITSAAIESLSQGDQGFFLMVEGGKIDWACHSNDGAAAIHEVLDFNNAVQKAYEFYQKHPEETLIIVTADHETGGMGVGSEDFNEDLQEAYEKSFVEHKNETSKSLYATSDKIADLAIKALNKASSVSWASGSHSAAYIPVYAIGVGSEEFHKKMDNVDIPRTVSKVAGWSHP